MCAKIGDKISWNIPEAEHTAQMNQLADHVNQFGLFGEYIIIHNSKHGLLLLQPVYFDDKLYKQERDVQHFLGE